MIKKHSNIFIRKHDSNLIISKTILGFFSKLNIFDIEKYLKEEFPVLTIFDYQWDFEFGYPLLDDNLCLVEEYNFDSSFFEHNQSRRYIEDLSISQVVLSEYIVLHFKDIKDRIKTEKLIKESYFKLDDLMVVFYKKVNMFEKNKNHNLIYHKDLTKEYLKYLESELFAITKKSNLFELKKEMYKIINSSDVVLKENNYGYLLFKDKHRSDLRQIRKYYNVLEKVCEKYSSFSILNKLTNISENKEATEVFKEFFIY